MASPIPAALKSADISRFALRAAQLEKVKPIVAYWSNYWIVNQIISNGLQNADEESKQYTMNVMDKLEQFKSENPNNDAIIDDMAGKAYIEQFGLETFQRADNTVRADKVTRQTADTFQASATFLELLQIFGPLDPEIAVKVKYAKFHALRIAKALRAGEDPNLSNPKPEPTPESQQPPLDQSDIEMLDGVEGIKPRQPSVQEVPDEADRIQRTLAARSELDESLHPSRSSSVPRPPTVKVEDVPDEADRISRTMAQKSVLDESLHPSRAPSLPRTSNDPWASVPPPEAAPEVDATGAENFYTSATQGPTSPGISPIEPPTERKQSIGGHYFPAVPSPLSPAEAESTAPPDLPFTPQNLASFPPPPIFQQEPPSGPPPGNQHQFLPPHSIPPSLMPSGNLPNQIPQAPPPQLRSQDASGPVSQSFYNSQPSVPQPPAQLPQHQHVPPTPDPPTVVDEEAIMKAQKHARWAISALNFEDVSTAIRELKGALESLGAR